MMTQARQIAAAQAAQTAAKQQASQAMKTVIAEGDRLASVLLASIKEHFGPRSEKVAEFGAKPFRGRKKKVAPETPGTPGTGTPGTGSGGTTPSSGSSHPLPAGGNAGSRGRASARPLFLCPEIGVPIVRIGTTGCRTDLRLVVGICGRS